MAWETNAILNVCSHNNKISITFMIKQYKTILLGWEIKANSLKSLT